eukprot:CAMPEP_0174721958 /NCGR_PEP_ID=MMETSP1094-20130205/37539_1 /TAXON_ID=156173 /ORGANISM="Chrysochromulina brevifilum, Strain UTEX LB 985" /LENGTH=97 /DNA_ID=CAMNT_0015922735 /DNA_START=536 /DNA_END=829 /DNA_ORIENTATION=+
MAKVALSANSSPAKLDSNFFGSQPPHQEADRYTTTLPALVIASLNSALVASFNTSPLPPSLATASFAGAARFLGAAFLLYQMNAMAAPERATPPAAR